MKREELLMNVTSVMSLVAATVFAVGVVGPAVAQTPATPAPAPAPAPAAPAKSGDMQMDKDAKKDGKAAAKDKMKKKHAAKKTEKTEGEQAPAAKTPEPKK
jgi:hypothetical protein